MCAVNLEDQFQTCLVAKLINFLIWKFRSIILIFLLFFAGVVKSSAFCTLLLLFQRVEVLKLHFDTKMWLKHFNLFEIALKVSKNCWIWQLLQGRRRILDFNFQIKKMITLTCQLVWNPPFKSPNTQPKFSLNVNVIRRETVCRGQQGVDFC